MLQAGQPEGNGGCYLAFEEERLGIQPAQRKVIYRSQPWPFFACSWNDFVLRNSRSTDLLLLCVWCRRAQFTRPSKAHTAEVGSYDHHDHGSLGATTSANTSAQQTLWLCKLRWSSKDVAELWLLGTVRISGRRR